MIASPEEITSEKIQEEHVEIFTTGHPRSGNTWIGRLLGDLLNSPLQTQPGDVIQFHGEGRDGKYVVRKRHTTDPLPGPGVFIYRDPRDVCVSKHFYNDHSSIQHTIEEMNSKGKDKEGIVDFYGPYEKFVRSLWKHPEKYSIAIKYEDLYYLPYQTLWTVLWEITGVSYGADLILECYERQRFSMVLAKFPEFFHSMRKGIVGDWENHFRRDDGRLFQEIFGKLMMDQGYIQDGDWWEVLPV